MSNLLDIMLYFKNTELAKLHNISLGTVRNWIEAAQQNKLDLSLHTVNNKLYIANTSSNASTIQNLVAERKKYRPGNSIVRLSPKDSFYTIYNESQIYDILTNLEVRREIPRQYSYFDHGAAYWDEYMSRVEGEESPSNLTMTKKLLEKNSEYIDDLTSKYKIINIVDVGVGNAAPARDLIDHISSLGKMGRYIAIDISPAMLSIAEKNINTWFQGKVQFEGYTLDIGKDRFSNILAEGYLHNSKKHTANLILFLGGTLQNFRKREIPLQVINGSMGVNDFLIHSQKLDSISSRRHFDFNVKPGSQTLPPIHRIVVDLLNISPEYYDIEMGYDQSNRERYEKIKLKIALEIKFNFADGERKLCLNKGETILVWRASQDLALDVLNQFDKNDFYVLQSSQTEDQEYILTISKVKNS